MDKNPTNHRLVCMDQIFQAYMNFFGRPANRFWCFYDNIHVAPVVRRVDNAIHRINLYSLDSVVCLHLLTLICWIAIYPVDRGVIQPSNSRGLYVKLHLEGNVILAEALVRICSRFGRSLICFTCN